MIRSTPARVIMLTSVATSIGWPWWARPPTPAYSPSEFSRTITQSRSSGRQRLSGASMPGRMRVGRTLAYWSKPWQIFRRRPHSVTWSGMSRVAGRAEQDGVHAAQRVEPVGRHHLAVRAVPVAAPAEAAELEAEGVLAGGQRLQHLLAGGDHFLADAVAGDAGDPVGLAHA